MRKTPRNRARHYYTPLIAALMVALSLVFVTGGGASAADGCQDFGYTKYEGSSDTNKPIMAGAVEIGTMSWSVGTITYDIDPGYTVEFCVKQANDPPYQSGPRTGSGSAVSPWNDMSHVGYKVVPTAPTNVTVNVTFVDNKCVNNTYVPLVFTANDFTGTTKSVNGSAVPGGTVTVVYTPLNASYVIVDAAGDGTKTFTHTYPAQPDAQADCDAPPPSCPDGQMDWNGPNVPGCGTPPDQPAAVEITQTDEGCVLTEFELEGAGEVSRTGVREYVWVANEPPTGNGSWQLEPESGIAWGDWTLTRAWTGQEYLDKGCAEVQPPALIREVAGVQASCRIQGTRSWVDVYTTEYVWNEETLMWEPGIETGPVRTDETFVEYTDKQFQNKCAEEPEVAGEQETVDHELPPLPEVKGEQASVPGAVNAGLGPTPAPLGTERNPLWLLVLIGGLGLMGVAGRRRRPAADR